MVHGASMIGNVQVVHMLIVKVLVLIMDNVFKLNQMEKGAMIIESVWVVIVQHKIIILIHVIELFYFTLYYIIKN